MILVYIIPSGDEWETEKRLKRLFYINGDLGDGNNSFQMRIFKMGVGS